MLFINYKGNTPQQRFYSIGVQQNNKANKICFIIDAIQGGLDFSEFVSYIKVQDKDHKYLDKCEPDEIVYQNDKLEIYWTLTRKTTEYRNIEVQLQFENDDDVVWQSLICELELNGTIKADEEISKKYPQAIQDLERTVHTFDDRLEDVEEGLGELDQKLEHDKEVLSKIVFSQGQDPTVLTFTKNVAPLVYYNSVLDTNYYFDYETPCVYDDNHNDVGVIYFEDNQVIAKINGELEPDLENDDITYIYFNNWVGINAWNLYHAQSGGNLVVEREFIGDSVIFRFPEGIIPVSISLPNNNYYADVSLTLNYQEGTVIKGSGYVDNYMRVSIERNQVCVEVGSQRAQLNEEIIFSYIKATTPYDDFEVLTRSLDFSTFNKVLKNGNDFQNVNCPTVFKTLLLTTQGNGTIPVCVINEHPFFYDSVVVRGNGIYEITSGNGLYVSSYGTLTKEQITNLFTTYTGMKEDCIPYTAPCVIPAIFFANINQLSSFRSLINNAGGDANQINSIQSDERKKLGIEPTYTVAYISIKLFPITPLEIKGTWKHTITISEQGNNLIEVSFVSNNPLEYNNLEDVGYYLESTLFVSKLNDINDIYGGGKYNVLGVNADSGGASITFFETNSKVIRQMYIDYANCGIDSYNITKLD